MTLNEKASSPPRQRRSPAGHQRPVTGLRISAEDLEQIDRLASEAGLSRTQFMIDAALGRRHVEAVDDAAGLRDELAELRERIAKLERRRTPARKNQ